MLCFKMTDNNSLDSSVQQQLQTELGKSMKMRGVPNLTVVTKAQQSGTISGVFEDALTDNDKALWGRDVVREYTEQASKQLAKVIDMKILLKMNEDPKSGFYHSLTFQKRQELLDKINYIERKYLEETPAEYSL